MIPTPPPLLGESPAFHAVLAHVSRVAPLERPLLIIGERGTGKELIAARLHYLSRRWDRPFVKVNCAALPETLLDSELFGHEAGAFTGAVRRQIGRIEQADTGTLFLDEIATASPAVQEKLLRAVEYGEIERVGGRTQTVDVRVIGATNADLPALAEAGRFRADLLDRLAFDVVTLPPLRARPEDIPLLAEHFALGMVRELERPFFPGFAPRALDQLLSHGWPGNVRELRNVIERAVVMCAGEEVIPADLPEALRTPVAQVDDTELALDPSADFRDRVKTYETALILDALARSGGNQTQAAKILRMPLRTLVHKMKAYGIRKRFDSE